MFKLVINKAYCGVWETSWQLGRNGKAVCSTRYTAISRFSTSDAFLTLNVMTIIKVMKGCGSGLLYGTAIIYQDGLRTQNWELDRRAFRRRLSSYHCVKCKGVSIKK
jgi:hypothetical protein